MYLQLSILKQLPIRFLYLIIHETTNCFYSIQKHKMANPPLKPYTKLSKEYRDLTVQLGSMSKNERETAAGYKLIKKLKQIMEQMDKITRENQRDNTPL